MAVAFAFSSPIPFPTTLPVSTRLSILSQLKHALIGHHARKLVVLAHAGALEQLVHSIEHHLRSNAAGQELELVNEAVTLLGTLSLPTQQAQHAFLTRRIHQTLLSALVYATSERSWSVLSSSGHAAASSPHDKLIESILRSIKVVYCDLVQLVGPSEWGDDLLSLTPVKQYEKYAKPNQRLPDDDDDGDEDEDDDDDESKDEGDDQAMHVDGAATRHERPSQQNLRRVAATAMTDLYSPTSSALLGLAPLLAFDPLSLDPQSLRLQHKRAELVCALFASTVRTRKQREAIFHTGTTPAKLWNALVGIVTSTTGRVQESAIAALSALFKDESDTLKACIGPQGGSPLFSTLNALSRSANSSRRLTATIARIVLCQSRRLSITFSQPEYDWAAAGELALDSVAATLVALVDGNEKLRGRACFALAYLVAIHISLETRGASNNRVLEVVKKAFEPTSIFATTTSSDAAFYEPPPNSTPIEAALSLIALMTAESEEDRQTVKEKGLIPSIVQFLSHPSANVRAAACHALRSLSRSVNLLRTILAESDAAKPLVALLRKGEHEVVRITAVATASNLLLEFSPMRPTLIEEGVVEAIVGMAKEGLGKKKSRGVGMRKRQELREINVLWALKNASYQASYAFKSRLLALFGWSDLRTFLLTRNTSVSEQAFGILRNLTCTDGSTSTPALFAPPPPDHDMQLVDPREVIKYSADVLSVEGDHTEWSALSEEGVRLQVLYTLVNLAAGEMAMKQLILIQEGLMENLVVTLKARNADIRCAAVWVFINLCQPIPTTSTLTSANVRATRSGSNTTAPSAPGVAGLSSPPTTAEIVHYLRSAGVHQKLREMSADNSLDVRERVKDALQGFAWD